MKLLSLFASITALTMVLLAIPAAAEKRVALVIGNSDYKVAGGNWSDLRNPANDARDFAAALKKTGFTLIGGDVQLNLTKGQMDEKIIEFGEQLGAGTVGLFFFAGHGMAVNKTNYLVPSKTKGVTKKSLKVKMVSADFVVDQFPEKGGLNILILDACRNTPQKYRGFRGGQNSGLVNMQAPGGTVISYSTQPGNFAMDGKGRNSPFAEALIKNVQTPGLNILDMFNEVGVQVDHTTDGFQRPWINYSPLQGKFYFAGKGDPQVASVQLQAPVDEKALDLAYWNSVKDSKDAADFEDYVAQYPDGSFKRIAMRRIAKLKQTETAALTPTAPAEPAFGISVLDEEMVALKTSNVRSEPSTRGQKISRIQAGRAISVLGKTTVAGSEWYQVVLEYGQTGYVFGSLLREQQIAVMMPPATLSTPKKKTTEPTAGTFMTPGKVFRDCADCPEMVVIPSGSFKMGLYEGDEDNQGNEGPVHKVTVSKEFAVGKYEVTQAQWQAVMGNNPSKFKGANSPVETVNWNDIKNFVRRLSAKTGKQYRLLSESEWEYAARASTTTKYHWGYTFSSSKANNGDSTKTVGSYAANSFGLHDLLGNVWEWVEDCDNFDYDDGPSTEAPRTTGDCSKRILRGGSHHSSPWSMRTTSRVAKTTDIRSDYFGFRIARTLSPQDAAAF